MVVDETLARYSDLSYGTGLVIYLLAAAVALAALGVRPTRAARRQAALVGAAGGPTPPITDAPGVGRVAERPQRSKEEKLSRVGYLLTLVGFLLHVGSLALRGLATDRLPWGNLYEFISLTCAFGVAAALFTLRRPEHRPLLAFVELPVVLLLFIGGAYLYADAGDVTVPLKSYWFVIHVSVVSASAGVLLVSGVASVLYLVSMYRPGLRESDSFVGRVFAGLPSAEALDRFAYRTVVVGFPLFGLGVVFGAIWAEAAWGRFWGWDPKETVSFIAWVIYAAYLHARATAGWRNTAAAWVNVAAFAVMVFNVFFINIVVAGLHSYAGV